MTDALSPAQAKELEQAVEDLVKHFEWSGLTDCDALAQECILRAIKKLQSGEQVRDLRQYVFGIARHVSQEERRKRDRQGKPLPEIKPTGRDLEGLYSALEAAKKSVLSRLNRKLFEAYFEGRGKSRIARRKDLAKRLGTSPNALRIRISRMVKRLREEVSGRTPPTTPG